MTLKTLRKAANLTQARLARLADVDQATISKIETGKLIRPGYGLLRRIARGFKKAGHSIDIETLYSSRRRRTRAA